MSMARTKIPQYFHCLILTVLIELCNYILPTFASSISPNLITCNYYLF